MYALTDYFISKSNKLIFKLIELYKKIILCQIVYFTKQPCNKRGPASPCQIGFFNRNKEVQYSKYCIFLKIFLQNVVEGNYEVAENENTQVKYKYHNIKCST